MRRLYIFLFLLLAGLASTAQQFHFVYLQTDNKQPFYVRINEKLYSSSASGYVVIPKLIEGTHTITVGFPKNEWPSQNIAIKVANKDQGFLLKNFESKGWGLFNLQTMEVVTSTNELSNQPIINSERSNDQFSSVLADVVNTPSIKEGKKEVVQTEIVQKPVEVKKETLVVIEDKKPDPASIQKVFSAKDTDGLAMVYVDKQSSGIDTIQIFIPQDQVSNEASPVIVVKDTTVVTEKKPESTTAPTSTKVNPKFIELELPNPNTVASQDSANQTIQEAEKDKVVVKSSAVLTMINSDCKLIATEDDFFKVRKKMTVEKNEEGMVTVAKKMFKQKCFSTEQIKNLSVLFLKEEEKYHFFDAAYPFVHDSQQFKLLESQLTDPYIITRFRAMLRN